MAKINWNEVKATPPLDEIRKALDEDDNDWWRMDCGHHQNAFEAACEEIDRLTAIAVAHGLSIQVFTQEHDDGK